MPFKSLKGFQRLSKAFKGFERPSALIHLEEKRFSYDSPWISWVAAVARLWREGKQFLPVRRMAHP